MELGKGYNTGCRGESGDRGDVDNEECVAANRRKFVFDTGLAYNITSNGLESYGLNKTGVQENQCILSAQRVTGVQLAYFCWTWDNTV